MQEEQRAPYDPMPHGPAEVGAGPVGGSVARGRALGPRAAARGRPAQRRRPLPLLDARGDRRRPRHPPPRLPRRHRELAARLQHRHDRPHRQRVPRRRGPHRRQPALEPPRRDGHRPLPARAPPRGRRRARRRTSTASTADRCACSASTTCPAPSTSRRWSCPRRVCFLFGQEGPGLSEARARGLRRDLLDRAVRLDPLHQRRRRGRGRDARVGAGVRRPRRRGRLARLSPGPRRRGTRRSVRVPRRAPTG